VQQSHFTVIYFNSFYRKFGKYLHISCATVSIYCIFLEIGETLQVYSIHLYVNSALHRRRTSTTGNYDECPYI